MHKQAIIRGFVKRAQESGISIKEANSLMERIFGSDPQTEKLNHEIAALKAMMELRTNGVGGAVAGAGLGGLAGAGVGAFTAPKDEEGNRKNVGSRASLGALLGAPLGAVAGGGLGVAATNMAA